MKPSIESALGSAKACTVPRRVNLAEAIVRRRLRWGEGLVERGVFLVSLSAILMIFLIFVFVGREALPVALGRTSNARVQKAIAAAEIPKLGPEKLATYLSVTVAELKSYDAEMIRQLVELKGQELAEIANPDARLNTTRWSLMIEPYRWRGYDKPEYIWQPVSEVPKFNIIPLIIGSLKATLVALLLSVPLGVGAAIYVSQLAKPTLREIVKPTIELLSGIPSVVLGFFALIVMASVLQAVFGYESRLNAFVAGVALGLTVIPIIFTISEDALSSVPKAYTHAALALGASPWKAAWQVVLPAAVPGVFAACVLGFGRAIGETMVVLMASGNASIVSASIFDSCRTLTASIAAELAEVVFGGDHYRILFLLGALLFAVTFATNLAGDVVVHRLKQQLEGKH
ncbi:MAG: phosphate ABC transporter permease subunit PstC [Verrucomicrobia bacterium]|nr:phosphate ABC transporter permease subunit PstC [Verrucomicrobiota bacterium]